MNVHIRWMIRHDMPEVLAIENESFEFPWTEEDFIRCLQQRNCIGMVAETVCGRPGEQPAEHGEQVVGFMIYELHKTRLHVLNFSVAPSQRRRGVGTQLADKLKSKMRQDRRTRITLEVRETNLPAQLFFRSQSFRAVSVLRDLFEDTSESAYRFEFPAAAEMEKEGRRGPALLKNRLADYFKEDCDVGFE